MRDLLEFKTGDRCVYEGEEYIVIAVSVFYDHPVNREVVIYGKSGKLEVRSLIEFSRKFDKVGNITSDYTNYMLERRR